MTALKPTDEQEQAIALFKTGDSLAIEAGAGTGKTSTLVMLAREGLKGAEGQYIAFNKALVVDATEKFPMSVTCNTAHSLAFRAVGKRYASRLNSSARMPGSQVAQKLGIDPMMATDFQGADKLLYPGYIAGLAVKTVTRFCQSADFMITLKHTPFVPGLSNESLYALRVSLVEPARVMWADLQRQYGWVPFKHEHYLKMWQLNDPVINADYILFDEAQDANPVIADIVAQQGETAQLVYVGDSQQEIYAWTGAVNALAQVETEHRTYLTQSFRFGAAIADRANDVLNILQAPLRLVGNPDIESRLDELDEPRCILVRTNAQGIMMMMAMQEQGKVVHFLGATAELRSFVEAAGQLMETGRSGHPDLQCFDSWASVREYVKEDQGGEELRLQVRLVDAFGPLEILKSIDQMPKESKADVVISTAHKAKGREWHSVKLANDFPQQADSDPADLRLLYVAVTRAKVVLDDTALKLEEPEEAAT